MWRTLFKFFSFPMYHLIVFFFFFLLNKNFFPSTICKYIVFGNTVTLTSGRISVVLLNLLVFKCCLNFDNHMGHIFLKLTWNLLLWVRKSENPYFYQLLQVFYSGLVKTGNVYSCASLYRVCSMNSLTCAGHLLGMPNLRPHHQSTELQVCIITRFSVSLYAC